MPGNIRLFQLKRDLCLDPNPPDLISSYMELGIQYGFITLFSVVFPLAPIVSLIANMIQVDTQKQNMIYQRRFKAETANGIGPWLEIINIITKLAVIINMGTLFFTSDIGRALFVGVDYKQLFHDLKQQLEGNSAYTLTEDLANQILFAGIEPTEDQLAAAEAAGVQILEPTWDVLDYFLMLIFLEHFLIILNMFLEIFITDVPLDAVEGARNTADLIEQYEHNPNSKLFAKKDWAKDANIARRDVYTLLGLEEGQAVRQDTLLAEESDEDPQREGLLHSMVGKGDGVPIQPFQNWMNRVSVNALGTNNVKASPYINRAEKKKLLREHNKVRKATLVTELPPINKSSPGKWEDN